MSDPGRIDELLQELRDEWSRLFEAIHKARADRHLSVSEATITWEVLKESVELRTAGVLSEQKIQALKSACVRMTEDLLKPEMDRRRADRRKQNGRV